MATLSTTGYMPSSEDFLQLNETVTMYDLMAIYYNGY